MSDNVRIPVELDTKAAKAKLKQLHKDKLKSKKRITAAARRTSRIAIRAFAFTGAASALGKFKNNEPGGNVDMMGEAAVAHLAKVQQFADDKLGFSAKASKSAREQTKAAFAYHVGKTGEMGGATDFYNTVKKMQNDAESGRNIIRQDPRFIGIDAKTASKAVAGGNMKLFFKNIEHALPFRMLDKGIGYFIDGISAD
tara:strand:+ start:1178 stop:1771 length:594 start_codon:yes stop_codon:yes gene_type:complete